MYYLVFSNFVQESSSIFWRGRIYIWKWIFRPRYIAKENCNNKMGEKNE